VTNNDASAKTTPGHNFANIAHILLKFCQQVGAIITELSGKLQNFVYKLNEKINFSKKD